MKKRSIAILAACALLCGCSGAADNTGSQVTAEAPSQKTQEASAPEKASAEAAPPADDQSPAGESNAADPAAPTGEGSGVSLVTGGDSRYNDVFSLNGTWCDPEELPFSVSTYDLLPDNYYDHFIFRCFNGKVYYLQDADPDDEMDIRNRLWSYDPVTGEEVMLYENLEETANILYADGQYVVMATYANEEINLKVVDMQSGKTVYDVPEKLGNIALIHWRGVEIVYDTMFLVGEYTLPEFDETMNIGLKVELLSGEMSLVGMDYSSVDYGVGNVCYSRDSSIDSIGGESRQRYYDIDENTGIWYEMLDTYFLGSITERRSSVLGTRFDFSWTDRNNATHFIGQTAYSVDSYADSISINRDHIFCARLSKVLPESVWNEQYQEYEQKWQYLMLIGMYDTLSESAQAALIEVDNAPDIYAENDCIYLIDRVDNKVTILRATDNSIS